MIEHSSPYDQRHKPKRSKALTDSSGSSGAPRALPNTLQPNARQVLDPFPPHNSQVKGESLRQHHEGMSLEPRNASEQRSPPPNSGTADWIVQIEVREVPGRGGRPASIEKFPFGTLDRIRELEDGRVEGPCFFIPDADEPDKRLAAARKRHKHKRFISRKETGGMWVWREL